ncbi:MAG: hypothetical protein E1N59_2836 [Puniceicoccaceae bacterium 5H]|nr:MAG: hypothetical protein E1N59_2836 [Puniceicoccaceae bacterium 5H]
MSWIQITEADVLTVLNAREIEKYRTVATAAGQADPVLETIKQVVDEVRGYVAACDHNELAAGDTIPSNLLQAALHLITVRIPARVDQKVSETRMDLYNAALVLLRQVAACKFRVEQPEGATDDTFATGAAVTVVKKTTPLATRDSLNGL